MLVRGVVGGPRPRLVARQGVHRSEPALHNHPSCAALLNPAPIDHQPPTLQRHHHLHLLP